jgi:hypothetical protein
MISPRAARLIARIHKWLGLIVFAQLAIWTATGLFFASFAIADVRGEKLLHPKEHSFVNMAKVKLSSTDALNRVAEDRPQTVILRSLAGQPVYEIRAEIGVFLVSAETGDIVSPVSEETARAIASAAWAGEGKLASMEKLEKAPHESGLQGAVWLAHFEGKDHPGVYVKAINGDVGPVRTDLWRTYDFLYGLHMMDYVDHENFNTPWMVAAAVLALSVVLFGVALLVHRFTRGLIKPAEQKP